MYKKVLEKLDTGDMIIIVDSFIADIERAIKVALAHPTASRLSDNYLQ